MVVKLDTFDVAYATVEQIENGEVTLSIPATRIKMGLKTQLDELQVEPTVHREIGVIGEDGGASAAVETTNAFAQTPVQSHGIPIGASIHDGEVSLDSSALDD